MTSRRLFFLIFSYCVIVGALVLTSLAFSFGWFDVSLLIGLVGSFLGLFQVALALHIYWLQNFSNEELEAIVLVFKTNGGKEVIKTLMEHDPVSLTTISSKMSIPETTISNALFALEEGNVTFSKPEFSSGSYVRVYSLNPKLRRISARFRSAM
jgi:DNA-binding transcriptional ArsR family regulator